MLAPEDDSIFFVVPLDARGGDLPAAGQPEILDQHFHTQWVGLMPQPFCGEAKGAVDDRDVLEIVIVLACAPTEFAVKRIRKASFVSIQYFRGAEGGEVVDCGRSVGTPAA